MIKIKLILLSGSLSAITFHARAKLVDYSQDEFNASSMFMSTARDVASKDVLKGSGFTLKERVGWAKLQEDGSIKGTRGLKSHCTSYSHAVILKYLGQLNQKGLIKLSSASRAALNSSLFRDTWNANGFAVAKAMELLGASSFRQPSAAKKGDLLTFTRANGTQHIVVFSHLSGNKVCYQASNRSTRGPGEQCESIRGATMTFSRFTNIAALQNGLDKLSQSLRSEASLADVRRRGGNGYVKVAALSLDRSVQTAAPISSRRTYASISPTVQR